MSNPVPFDNKAAGTILGSIVIWLLELHFASVQPGEDGKLVGEEGRAHYAAMGLPRADVDAVVDVLEEKFQAWQKTQKEKETVQ